MNLGFSDRTLEYQRRLERFMDEHVYPAERIDDSQFLSLEARPLQPAIMERLKKEARAQGLWNMFLTNSHWGPGLSNVEYAPLAEITGRSPLIAPEAVNCSAPDTGNMEILARFGSDEQQEQWLRPLLEGEIRSCFAMTEPDVASSDATNIRTRIERSGDNFVINGSKWWSSGAMSPRCKIAIVMGVSNPDADRHRRQSMILVPLDSPGVHIERSTSVFGYSDSSHGGHGVIHYDNVHVPATDLLGEEGSGFAIAQERLGPGRIHHCMRLVGMAERALELMCRRVRKRVAFGRPLAEQGVIQEWIAESRIEIEQVRLLILKAAWLMDTVGNREAHTEIVAIKAATPSVACRVIDRAIQAHGGAGVSGDFPLAVMYAQARLLRIADGPDEVHKRSIAHRELQKYASEPGAA